MDKEGQSLVVNYLILILLLVILWIMYTNVSSWSVRLANDNLIEHAIIIEPSWRSSVDYQN